MKWLKDVWKILWEYEDTPPGSLNQTDKRYLWYGSFMTCLTVLALSTLGDLAGTLIANHRIQQQQTVTLPSSLLTLEKK